MKRPSWWNERGVIAYLLNPLSWLYRLGAIVRENTTSPYQSSIPVICVGNTIAGGAGKTPMVMWLYDQLKQKGYHPHIVSRGYGGSIRKSTLVDTQTHTANQVGDEPLLIAQKSPVWVSSDRVTSIKNAINQGADCIVMDDGMQNPTVKKDCTILMMDATFGFGNGFIIPAGPCREAPERSIQKSDVTILVGKVLPEIKHYFENTPTHRAYYAPTEDVNEIKETKVIAFAGIAHPNKFFDALAGFGMDLVNAIAFPDHHPFSEEELRELWKQANEHDAILLTTEKDWVRLNQEWRERIQTFPITLEIERSDELIDMVIKKISS